VKHAQGPDITNLYLGSWVRGKRGYGLAVGRRESLLCGSYLDSFGGDVLLG